VRLPAPDQQIQTVCYYRWRTYQEHLRYTDPTDGWISTEFLDCCGYAAPYQRGELLPLGRAELAVRATSQTLTGMANLLDDYPAQPTVTAANYYRQLRTYALTQYRNGQPYVAETHAPRRQGYVRKMCSTW